jgi:bifunctional UDP-N-acetylglucosamine pyrophosphorylase / glucosamine-1-phosphate N-acetyltransferase
MVETNVLIAAAGRGSRAGLPYPKTLFPVQGKPILLRICDTLRPWDRQPTIIVSPSGEKDIGGCLAKAGAAAHLVRQMEPKGMGDAVLQFSQSPAFAGADHVLLIWGDLPFVQPETVAAMVDAHHARSNDFTFVTRVTNQPYTLVERTPDGGILRCRETREEGMAPPEQGERDIGLFVFRRDVVMSMLKEELPGKRGKATGEHGFLYVIGWLVERKFRVEALPIAKEIEIVSLNSLEDLGGFD